MFLSRNEYHSGDSAQSLLDRILKNHAIVAIDFCPVSGIFYEGIENMFPL